MEQYTALPSQRLAELIIKFIQSRRDKIIKGNFHTFKMPFLFLVFKMKEKFSHELCN